MGVLATLWRLIMAVAVYSVAAVAPTDGLTTVEPVNHFPPNFNFTDIRASVPEGSPVGHFVVIITAYDKDLGDGGMITYSFQATQTMFRMDPVSGVVSVASYTTDYETKDTYVLIVQAQDGGGLVNIRTLIISIDDVNDNPPVFRQTQYDMMLFENGTSLSKPLRLEATDKDKPGTDNSNITYSLSSTTPPGLTGHFHIDPLTGDITVVQPLDFDNISFSAEQVGAITLTAVASDHGLGPLSSTVEVSITLLDINDNTPQFEYSEYHVSVPENIAVGSQVVMLRARDADGSAPNNHVYYFLETGDRDQFTIDHVTGSITVVDMLDHESVATYSIKVMARDQAADPLHSFCTVHIDVADVNDEQPRFRENHVTVDVTPDLLGAVYNMSAVDVDQNSVLKYFILWTDSYGQSQALGTIPGEDLRAWIDIDSEYGMIYTKVPIGSTQVTKFNLTLQVQDVNASEPSLQQDTGKKKWEESVIFSAGLSHYQEATKAQRIVYDTVFVNEGSGYNNITGIFTCPRTGGYVFKIHLCAPRHTSLWLSLYHEVTSVQTMEVHADEYSKAETVTVVLQLMQGDEVYLASTPGHSSRMFGAPDAILNTFSSSFLSPAFK
ncbi:hypothetical protein C0Q70_00374 [Pomacea canaliculata]|uniref:Uncharacterized protein n=1 Tax=Pomacea canaliculata TaxID=400727 RepID=A0A2T7PWH9_POMCA|nr:hypothetical protein C0Q70_00374 [Pomacea canaliculata]